MDTRRCGFWDGPRLLSLLIGLGLLVVNGFSGLLAFKLLFEVDLVTVTALGVPRRATIGLRVFMDVAVGRFRVGIGGVVDRGESTGLFFSFDLTLTAVALPRMIF